MSPNPKMQSKAKTVLQKDESVISAMNPITICMINSDGLLCKMSNITEDIKITDLIRKSFELFEEFNMTERKSVFMFNAILVRSGQILKHFKTVKQNELMDNDELILVDRYTMLFDEATDVTNSSKAESSKQNLTQVANQTTIDEVTKNMTVINKKKKKGIEHKSPHCNHFLVQRELENAITALIEISTKLVCFQEPNSVFHEIVRKLGINLTPDSLHLQKILQMGYDIDISTVALTLKKNNLKEAVEWLATESPSVTHEDLTELKKHEVNYKTVNINSENFSSLVMDCIKYMRKKQELDCDVNEKYFKRIKEVGFSDDNQVRRALRKFSNEPNRACLFLLGDLLPKQNLVDMNCTCAVFVDKILTDPESIVALSNKNVLIGLIDLIESTDLSDNLPLWMERSKVDAHLMKFVQTFETEKHYSHGCRDAIFH